MACTKLPMQQLLPKVRREARFKFKDFPRMDPMDFIGPLSPPCSMYITVVPVVLIDS